MVAGGNTTIGELFARFASKKARLRDFRRRTLADLEGFRMQRVAWTDADLTEHVRDRLELGPPIIEISEDGGVTLTSEWRENLEDVRTAGREQEDAAIQARKIKHQQDIFHARRKGQNVADKTPDMPKSATVRKIIVKGRTNDAASRLREQREKAGLPVEEFIRDRLAALGKIRLGLLEQIWKDQGGNPAHVYPTARLMGCRLVARPEVDNAVFVYPSAETEGARPSTVEADPPPDNLVPLFPGAERQAV